MRRSSFAVAIIVCTWALSACENSAARLDDLEVDGPPAGEAMTITATKFQLLKSQLNYGLVTQCGVNFTSSDRSPGLQISFRGNPVDADKQVSDYPCIEQSMVWPTAVADPLSGLSSTERKVWKPFSYAGAGPMYASMHPNAGLGFATWIGLDESNMPLPFGIKQSYSSNPDTQSVYITAHLEETAVTVRPFVGATATMDARIGMALTILQLDANVSQFQQKFSFVIYMPSNPKVRIEYSINIALAGINRRTYARLWNDPDQGGHIVVGGVLNGFDAPTYDKSGSVQVLTSLKNATQHATFSERPFRLQVTFDQVLDVLEHMGVSLTSSIENPANWALKNVKAGQEFHHPAGDLSRAVGWMKYVQIEAY